MPVDPSPVSEMEVSMRKRTDSDQHNCLPSDTENKKLEHPDAMSSSSWITNDSINRFTSSEVQRYEYDTYSVYRIWLTEADPAPGFGPKKFQKTIPMTREGKSGDQSCSVVSKRLSPEQHSESGDDDIEVANALWTPDSMQATVRKLHCERKTLIGEDDASFLPNNTMGHNNGVEDEVKEFRKSLENYSFDERSEMISLVSLNNKSISHNTSIGEYVANFQATDMLCQNEGVTIPENKVEESLKSQENDSSDEISQMISLVSLVNESISQNSSTGEDAANFPPNETLVHNEGVTIPENEVEESRTSRNLENYAAYETSQMESLVSMDEESIPERPQDAKIAYNKDAMEIVNAEKVQKRKITDVYADGKSSETGNVVSMAEESISKRLRSSTKASKSSIPPLITSIKLRSRKDA